MLGLFFMWQWICNLRLAISGAHEMAPFQAYIAVFEVSNVTDLDDYKALLSRTGVKFTKVPDARWTTRLDITVVKDNNDVTYGYAGFTTSLCFDESGKLENWAVWE